MDIKDSRKRTYNVFCYTVLCVGAYVQEGEEFVYVHAAMSHTCCNSHPKDW